MKQNSPVLRLLGSERVISFLSPFLLLVIWEICARAAVIDVRFFPAPTTIIGHMYVMVLEGSLWENLGISLQRLFLGLIVGGIPGILIGLAMGLWRPVRAALNPLISSTYPIPKSSLLPLILLIVGFGEASKVTMVAIGVFYPVVINTTAGVMQIPSIYLDVGQNFRASKLAVFRTIALPGALPLIMTGLKLGAGMGLVLIAIAEMVGAKSGIGYMIWSAWELFDVSTMYVGLFVIAVIGFLLNSFFDWLERRIVPWKKS